MCRPDLQANKTSSANPRVFFPSNLPETFLFFLSLSILYGHIPFTMSSCSWFGGFKQSLSGQNASDLVPCGPTNSTNPVVPCCFAGDTCLSNSLCQYSESFSNSTTFYTSGCSSPEFPGNVCAQRCGMYIHQPSWRDFCLYLLLLLESEHVPDVYYGGWKNNPHQWKCCLINTGPDADDNKCSYAHNDPFAAPLGESSI